MFVLTEEDNEAALAAYRHAGAGDPESCVLLNWALDRSLTTPKPADED
jgi:hypothetical protein